MVGKDLQLLNQLLINHVSDLENSYSIRVEEISFRRQYVQSKSEEGPLQVLKLEPTFKISFKENE